MVFKEMIANNSSGKLFIQAVEASTSTPNPSVLRLISDVKASGRKVCAITNNWYSPTSNTGAMEAKLKEMFDVFVESRHFDILYFC
jgi:hypothetical protein